jgi:hypothetical protein
LKIKETVMNTGILTGFVVVVRLQYYCNCIHIVTYSASPSVRYRRSGENHSMLQRFASQNDWFRFAGLTEDTLEKETEKQLWENSAEFRAPLPKITYRNQEAAIRWTQ